MHSLEIPDRVYRLSRALSVAPPGNPPKQHATAGMVTAAQFVHSLHAMWGGVFTLAARAALCHAAFDLDDDGIVSSDDLYGMLCSFPKEFVASVVPEFASHDLVHHWVRACDASLSIATRLLVITNPMCRCRWHKRLVSRHLAWSNPINARGRCLTLTG